MCTALDLAKQRRNQPIIDYLMQQKNAKTASELSEDVLEKERTNIEENLKSGSIYWNIAHILF